MKKLTCVVHKILDDYGCSAKYNGTYYLRDSICMFLEGQCEIEGLSAVYATLADKYNVGIWSIERSIRTLISKWWDSGKCGGFFVKRPTNGDLIYTLTAKIRAKLVDVCCAGLQKSS